MISDHGAIQTLFIWGLCINNGQKAIGIDQPFTCTSLIFKWLYQANPGYLGVILFSWKRATTLCQRPRGVTLLPPTFGTFWITAFCCCSSSVCLPGDRWTQYWSSAHPWLEETEDKHSVLLAPWEEKEVTMSLSFSGLVCQSQPLVLVRLQAKENHCFRFILLS